jgi:hypothetical protein
MWGEVKKIIEITTSMMDITHITFEIFQFTNSLVGKSA